MVTDFLSETPSKFWAPVVAGGGFILGLFFALNVFGLQAGFALLAIPCFFAAATAIFVTYDSTFSSIANSSKDMAAAEITNNPVVSKTQEYPQTNLCASEVVEGENVAKLRENVAKPPALSV